MTSSVQSPLPLTAGPLRMLLRYTICSWRCGRGSISRSAICGTIALLAHKFVALRICDLRCPGENAASAPSHSQQPRSRGRAARRVEYTRAAADLLLAVGRSFGLSRGLARAVRESIVVVVGGINLCATVNYSPELAPRLCSALRRGLLLPVVRTLGKSPHVRLCLLFALRQLIELRVLVGSEITAPSMAPPLGAG
jgi:hypothetical protein